MLWAFGPWSCPVNAEFFRLLGAKYYLLQGPPMWARMLVLRLMTLLYLVEYNAQGLFSDVLYCIEEGLLACYSSSREKHKHWDLCVNKFVSRYCSCANTKAAVSVFVKIIGNSHALQAPTTAQLELIQVDRLMYSSNILYNAVPSSWSMILSWLFVPEVTHSAL